MRASLVFLAAWSLCAAGCAGDDGPAGPRPDLGPGVDLGVDAGARDASMDAARDASRDATVDASMDAAVDGGMDAGPRDLGRPCEQYDAAARDFGPLPELGTPSPDEIMDLGLAPDGDVGYCPSTTPSPGVVNGCPQYTYCLAPLDAGTGLTYDGFAAPLFAAYCTRCHSSTLTTLDARSLAPLGRDWDVRASVYAFLPRIRVAVGIANFMPNDRPCLLPCERRRQLVTWIDEGAP